MPLDNGSEVLVDWYVCEGVFVDCSVLSLTSALIVVEFDALTVLWLFATMRAWRVLQ